MSRPTVHPVEAPSLVDDGPRYPGVSMMDVQGMPGTRGGLTLRLIQSVFGLISVCVMATTAEFRAVSAFCVLVFAVGLQVLWTVSLTVVDVYALLVRRRLRKRLIVQLFAAGDGITCTLTFAAASASAGVTVLVGNDLYRSSVNHCSRFETATAFAFMSWFAMMPSFFMNFWTLASQ